MRPDVKRILAKLSKEKVELANVNQLSSLVQQSRSEEAEMVDDFLDAKASSKKGIKAAEKHIRNLKEVKSLVNDVESAAKELGVDASSIKEWKKAKDFLNGNPINATEKMISKMKSLL
tara:strand:+ start:88 stop:441 length:354 start_codon:yes stop_codon:yes gene_type:complete